MGYICTYSSNSSNNYGIYNETSNSNGYNFEYTVKQIIQVLLIPMVLQ